MKRLIVNADDLGLTRGVNRAIAACHERGIVTSATLMATSARFEEAVELAAQFPQLSIGCHIVLVDGEPLLPPGQVRSLLAPGTNRFYHSITDVLFAVLRGRFRAEEIQAEAEAQFARIRKAGVQLSHFDTHKHTHMFPSILRPLLRAAAANDVNTLRNPFEYPRSISFRASCRNKTLLIRKLETTVLRALFARKWQSEITAAGFRTTDGAIGVSTTGSLDEAAIREMLKRMPEGTWELVCHPGYNDSELAGVRTKLRASRETEMSALLAISRSELQELYGIELSTFDLGTTVSVPVR